VTTTDFMEFLIRRGILCFYIKAIRGSLSNPLESINKHLEKINGGIWQLVAEGFLWTSNPAVNWQVVNTEWKAFLSSAKKQFKANKTIKMRLK
jgi:hypothetical protein